MLYYARILGEIPTIYSILYIIVGTKLSPKEAGKFSHNSVSF
jgi:hypothetical protein